MKIDIFNIDKFVEANHCEQVSDVSFYDSFGSPTEKGLFSYSIFGMTELERKNKFAYIDLGGNYLHPLIFSIMSTRMGSLRDVIFGNKYAVIADKKLKYVSQDTPGAETGLDFLYDKWEQIDWLNQFEEDEIESLDKKSRLTFLKVLKKNEIFCTKWLVVPPYYREEAADGSSLGDHINELYKNLISRTNSMKTGGKYSFFGETTKIKIQQLLLEIFIETTKPLKGKNSLLRRHLMGKAIDYTACNVITAPQNSVAFDVKHKPVKFGESAFPLPTLISCFMPFVIGALHSFIEGTVIPNIYSNIPDVKSIDIESYSSDRMEKLLKQFINSPSERTKPFTISYTSTNNEKKEITISIFEANSKQDFKNNKYTKRLLTNADLIYIICELTLSDKHAVVTRYPVDTFQNIYPCRVKVLSTTRTHPAYISFNEDGENGKQFDNYPYIRYTGAQKVPNQFYEFFEVFYPGNAVLKGMNADYDGDTMYIRGLFSKEANDECERLIHEKTNVLRTDGSLVRSLGGIGKDAVMALYELTKEGT